MSNLNIIRAWKDEDYRLSLSAGERASLPEHPAGLIELTDAALDEAAGGNLSVATAGLAQTQAFVCNSIRGTLFYCQPQTIDCPA